MNLCLATVSAGLNGVKKGETVRFRIISRPAMVTRIFGLMTAVFLSGCAAAPQGSSIGDADTDALFSRLEALAPDPVVLQRLECRGDRVIVTGTTDRLAAVSGYMRNIAEAGWTPILGHIEPPASYRHFVFSVQSAGESKIFCRDKVRDYPIADSNPLIP